MVTTNNNIRSNNTLFTTVLPHEPLPSHPYGYVNLHGAFVPKRKEEGNGNQGSTSNPSSPVTVCCSTDAEYIQSTLTSNLKSLLQLCGMNSSDILSVHPIIIEEEESPRNHNNNDISKVRIQLTSPFAARQLTSRLRRGNYGPRDLLASTITVQNGIILQNEGICSLGCGGRYAGRAVMVTQVTPITISNTIGDINDTTAANADADETILTRWTRAAHPKFRRLLVNSNSKKYKLLTEEESEIRRAMTRFVYLDNVLGNELTLDDFNTITFLGDDDDDDDGDDADNSCCSQEKREERESKELLKSRIKNDLLSLFQGKGSPSIPTTTNTTKNNISHKNIMGVIKNGFLQRDARVEDDIRHAFQDALRDALAPYDFSRNNSSDNTGDNGDDGSGSGGTIGTTTNQCQGIEVFVKADVAAGKKSHQAKTNKSTNDDGGSTGMMLFDHFHIGMRSNGDATRVIQSLQGKRLHLKMVLPVSFVQQAVAASASSSFATSSPSSQTLSKQPTTITITTGKLYLDYADVVIHNKGLRKNRKTHVKVRNEPSKSECTSTTAHVHIDGLHVIPDYISVREEQLLMAGLMGPHAPWAPPQYTSAGGHIKRRVQHYGYVFDYESSDVLRRDEDDDDGTGGSCGGDDGNDGDEKKSKKKKKSACPPLPCIDANVAEMTDEEVEAWTERAVEDVKVWDALAGVIERTRRFDVSSKTHVNPEANLNNEMNTISLEEGDNASNSHFQTYPNINQLTVNEYNPGEGIGSHVDTVTAFGDGLLAITLNGGIVMEFRKATVDDDAADKNVMRKLVYLPPRSLAVLSGDARYKYEHMIVSRMTDTVDGNILPRKLRVSLTLRTALTKPVLDETAERFSLAQSKVVQSPLPKYESKVFPPRWGQESDAALMNANSDVDNNGSSSSDRSALFTPATESKHVHAVYDAIATQWHHTRGKRGVLWPGATQFLETLSPGSIVADVGCGDGKYFAEILKHSYFIGFDMSEELLKTAATRDKADDNTQKCVDGPQYQHLSKAKRTLSAHPAVAVADCIHVPLKSGSCDAAICIAVMHHLSTEKRRVRCLSELKRIVKVGGRINVQAWALEQTHDSKRKFHGTDVLVPFNAQPKYLQTPQKLSENGNSAHTISSVESKGKGVAQMMAEQYNGAEFDSKKNLVVFQRYCHMYRKGELESLCNQVPGLEVLESSYEKGNHVVSLRVCGVGGS